MLFQALDSLAVKLAQERFAICAWLVVGIFYNDYVRSIR